MKLEPRKKSDRGGYLAMPLRKNVQEPHDRGWKLTRCPMCGRECWERAIPDWLRESVDGIVCTECALMKGINQEN